MAVHLRGKHGRRASGNSENTDGGAGVSGEDFGKNGGAVETLAHSRHRTGGARQNLRTTRRWRKNPSALLRERKSERLNENRSTRELGKRLWRRGAFGEKTRAEMKHRNEEPSHSGGGARLGRTRDRRRGKP
jgi:hypothetical protein